MMKTKKKTEIQRLIFLLILMQTTLTVVAWMPNSSANQGVEAIPYQTDTIVRKLDEVVVGAFNRRQNLVKVPGALTSVGTLVLEREKPSVNLLPIFEYVPGVFAQQGATNTSRVVIRGTGARVPYATGKIRAYFNNIPLTNASGFTFIDDIDPSVVESIEIIKGPAPSVYGAGLGGTIVLNAKSPRARSTGFQNTFQMGSFGMVRNVSALDLVGKHAATSLVYSHTQSEGYRVNNEYRRDAVTSVTQFQPSERLQMTALFAFSGLMSHIPSSIDSVLYIEKPESAAANWMRTRGYEDATRLLSGVSGVWKIYPRLSANLSLFGLFHNEKEMRPFDVFYEERFTMGGRFRVIHEQILGVEGWEISAGGEVSRDNYFYSNYQNIGGEGVQGDQLTDNRENVDTYNFFAQSDLTYGMFNLSAGLNINYTHRDYRDLFNAGLNNRSGVYDYGLMVSPRIALGYSYYASNAVYLSVSHGFAPPSLDETLDADGFVNMEIRPEKSWNYEVGFRGKVLGERLFYDLSIYTMQVSDLLVAERVGEDAWVGRNAGRSAHRGVEGEIHWVAWRNFSARGASLQELSIRSNLTLNRFFFRDFVDRGVVYNDNKIPGVPDYVFFAGLYAQSATGLYLMPSWRITGPMAMNDANTRFTRKYAITNVVAGYRNVIASRIPYDLFFRVNNIFDMKYASMILVNAPSFGASLPRYYYPGLPLNVAFGLKITV
jgi:iron complex outermembrane recepter protein